MKHPVPVIKTCVSSRTFRATRNTYEKGMGFDHVRILSRFLVKAHPESLSPF